jgi:hypothetical protein
MLTIFSIPKPFTGAMDVIQRNAIKSWTLLRPKCEVILMGDDEGTDKAAADLGVRHIPDLNRNEYGTPLLDHAFQMADTEGKFPLNCWVNADIILMDDILEAVKRVQERTNWFLMTAQRTDLDLTDPLEFEQGWKDRLLEEVSQHGKLAHITGIDFWIYPKKFLENMPPFAIGRVAYESWCLYTARRRNAELIDATKVVVSVHQNHDYSHHPQGHLGVGRGTEAARNREMVGGKPYFFIIKDRTLVLTKRGLKQPVDGWRLWRGLRRAQVLPLSGPLPLRLPATLLAKGLNSAINAMRDLSVMTLHWRSRRTIS